MKQIITSILEFYKERPSIFFLTISLAVLCLLINKYYPAFRGFMGEFWLKKELQHLPNKEYKVLSDIMIKHNEMTYQIDCIVISKYGIFVVEMKNFYGKIYGNEYNKFWTQRLGVSNKNFIIRFSKIMVMLKRYLIY